jgi:peptidoglycan/LPS O-acetylase OafA/YrhL
MNKGTSLYLDLVRFSAALMVFLEHLRERTRHSFGAFWDLHPRWDSWSPALAHTAVIVFFVMSGYVIAHVLATREQTLIEYSASRLARLYSVIMPALLLIAVTNDLEALKDPGAFARAPSALHGGIAPTAYYLGTAFLVNHFWLWPDLEPPNAYPFWSLSFEATYYVGVALFVFARGRFRFLALVTLGAVAGPSILLLAPTWILGYAAYHYAQQRRLPARSGIVLWLGSIFFLSLCPIFETNIFYRLPLFRFPNPTLGTLLTSYAAAICFTANLIVFRALSDMAEPVLLSFPKVIRWLGSMTFALYLFHQPLLSFFTFYNLSDRSSVGHLFLLVGGTFLVVATLGRFCEQTKSAYKHMFVSIGGRVLARSGAVN